MRGSVRDAAGVGVPNVMISDGRTITRTGADGRFGITPVGPFVFLTRPAGFVADPWFVPADADEVAFTLTAAADVFPYRFVHVSDLHVSVDDGARLMPRGAQMGSEEALARFLAGLPRRAGEVQSVIATGDLTDLGLDVEYDDLRSAVGQSPLPVHLLPGNHDHMAGTHTRMSTQPSGYYIHDADTGAYERHLGPRWYSFDLPDLHVVALDWHTHELGMDDAEQNAWLRADLETAGDRPWILLSHDQPWHTMLDDLPRPPVATFSGHRHTSRVVRVGPTLHVNTPTPLFAGLDYSPPSYRIVRWDGERIGLETRAIASTGLERSTFSMPAARPVAPADGVRWRHQLTGAGHRSPVRVAGEAVYAPVKREDEPSGAVEALGLADGAPRWRAELRASVKGTPAVDGGTVVAVEVSGDTVGLDAATGRERWRAPSPDPLRLFAWADPVVVDGLAIVGDLTHLRTLSVGTGELVWERTGLSAYQTMASQSNPVLAGDVLILGNFPAPIGLAGFDVKTGATAWALRDDADSVLGGLWPIGTPLVDDGALYVPTPAGLVTIDLERRTARWRLDSELPFSPATPAATPYGVATVFAGRDLVLLDRGDGRVIWRTPLGAGSASEFAMASYTRTPRVLFAGPVAATTGDETRLLVSGLDGWIYSVDARTGERRAAFHLGAPIAAPVVVHDDLVIAVAVDGTVTAVDRAAVC